MKVLKNQNEELASELEIMARTDDLIRNRLDRKREAEEIYRQNQERLLKS